MLYPLGLFYICALIIINLLIILRNFHYVLFNIHFYLISNVRYISFISGSPIIISTIIENLSLILATFNQIHMTHFAKTIPSLKHGQLDWIKKEESISKNIYCNSYLLVSYPIQGTTMSAKVSQLTIKTWSLVKSQLLFSPGGKKSAKYFIWSKIIVNFIK